MPLGNNIIRILRSAVAGKRPTGRSQGEPYVNEADKQFGVEGAGDLIAVRYLESLVAIANGPANKIFLPTEVSGIMGSIGGIAELFKDGSGISMTAPAAHAGRPPREEPPAPPSMNP
jgi:hypothetical protein